MSRSNFLKLLFIVTIANFAAQIPYYLHQYYLPSHSAPSPIGVILMTAVLIWFLAGFYGLSCGRRFGYGLTLSFLIVEFLFYLQTQITQYLSGHGVLLYVLHPSGWVLFIIFGIGYVNFFASAGFIYLLLKDKSRVLRM